MKSTRTLVLSGIIVFILGSCQKAPDSAGSVVWPALSAFDEAAAKAEGLAQVKDIAALRQLLPGLVESASAVSPSSVPGNAKNSEGLRQHLLDLADLSSKLSEPLLGDEDLITYTLALHPLVAEMMTAAGLPHVHANEGPHGGFFHPLFAVDGKQAATAEIKLHDDAGDVEIWLTQGGRDGSPLDLPLDSLLKLEFPAMERFIELGVRDKSTNADEDGNPSIRDGQTNYFIFPGETDADASWLMGEDFAAKVRLIVPGNLSSEVLVLKPHVHHD